MKGNGVGTGGAEIEFMIADRGRGVSDRVVPAHDRLAFEQIRFEKGRLEKVAKQSAGMSPAAIRALYRLKTAERDA